MSAVLRHCENLLCSSLFTLETLIACCSLCLHSCSMRLSVDVDGSRIRSA